MEIKIYHDFCLFKVWNVLLKISLKFNAFAKVLLNMKSKPDLKDVYYIRSVFEPKHEIIKIIKKHFGS